MVHLPYNNNPTIDIYFANSLKDLIAKPFARSSSRPISRIGPNCFVANNKAIVIRYITAKELSKLRKLNLQEIIYLIDDDLHFLSDDHSLPADYRERLIRFGKTLLPELLAITDTVVAPNQLILGTYPGKNTFLLNPSATNICTDFSHFDDPTKIEIVFAGTRSHLSDLKAIEGEIFQFCQRNTNVHLTTFLGKHAPEKLVNQNNITHRNARSWQNYRKIQQTERFHIAIAPLLDTRFNRCRSINKIYDHAAFGTAGIYSNLPPLNQIIDNNQSGLIINTQSSDWSAALENLVYNLPQTRAIAEKGAELAERLGSHEIVRKFWVERLF